MEKCNNNKQGLVKSKTTRIHSFTWHDTHSYFSIAWMTSIFLDKYLRVFLNQVLVQRRYVLFLLWNNTKALANETENRATTTLTPFWNVTLYIFPLYYEVKCQIMQGRKCEVMQRAWKPASTTTFPSEPKGRLALLFLPFPCIHSLLFLHSSFGFFLYFRSFIRRSFHFDSVFGLRMKKKKTKSIINVWRKWLRDDDGILSAAWHIQVTFILITDV